MLAGPGWTFLGRAALYACVYLIGFDGKAGGKRRETKNWKWTTAHANEGRHEKLFVGDI